jgi:hypothetical protein
MTSTEYMAASEADARQMAEFDGMNPIDVLVLGNPRTDAGQDSASTRHNKENPALWAILGLMIPIAGLMAGVVKWHHSRDSAIAAMLGAGFGSVLCAIILFA